MTRNTCSAGAPQWPSSDPYVAEVNPTVSGDHKPTRPTTLAQSKDHLLSWIEGLADDMGPDQHSTLWNMLCSNVDVLSSGPDDLGQTDLVTYTIDTGDTRPIDMPPCRLPITKQMAEKPEIQNMLHREVIEPSTSP